MVNARIGVYKAVFQQIAAVDVSIILRGVDRRQLAEKYGEHAWHPHRVVLMHLLERVDEFAVAEDELALVIADQVNGQEGYRENLWEFKRWRTSGYRSRRIERIVDTIHFVPSHQSRLVQAADMIVFLHRRMRSVAPQDARVIAANERLWSTLQQRVAHDLCWNPNP